MGLSNYLDGANTPKSTACTFTWTMGYGGGLLLYEGLC